MAIDEGLRTDQVKNCLTQTHMPHDSTWKHGDANRIMKLSIFFLFFSLLVVVAGFIYPRRFSNSNAFRPVSKIYEQINDFSPGLL